MPWVGRDFKDPFFPTPFHQTKLLRDPLSPAPGIGSVTLSWFQTAGRKGDVCGGWVLLRDEQSHVNSSFLVHSVIGIVAAHLLSLLIFLSHCSFQKIFISNHGLYLLCLHFSSSSCHRWRVKVRGQ